MRSNLFQVGNLENDTADRFTTQGSKMLRVSLGEDVLALKGSMVAYQGDVRFDHESAGSVGKMLRRMVTSEDTPLMRVSGAGEVFFAQRAAEVFLVHLEGDAVSVNGTNLLAFDATLDWDVERTRGTGFLAGGAFNTRISGHGTVALISEGAPVVLDCGQQRTAVDVQAAVCWSGNLSPQIGTSANVRSMLRGGTGELAQMVFHGPGFVVVQPSEGPPPAPQQGSGSAGGGLLDLL